MKGKPHSSVTRQRIGAANKGKKKPPFSPEQIAHMREARRGRKPALGMRHSAEARRKMSEARKGDKNSRWIDGRKQTPYPSEWTKELRQSIRNAQQGKCAMCGLACDHLNVHHIDWDKCNCSPDNLVALCKDCHGLAHRKSNLGFYELLLRTIKRGVIAEMYPPAIILKPAMIVVGERARLDGMIKLEGGLGLHIGAHTHICSFCHLNIGGGILWIGDEVGIASGVRILSGSNMPDMPSMSVAALPERQRIERRSTLIGHQATLGVNSVVLMGLTIGQGAVIGAGAVVTHDVPAWEIWAGVPAKKIGERPHA